MSNLSTTTVVSIMIGVVLLYAAVKKMDPRDVIRKALGKEPKFGFFGEIQGFAKPINPIPPGGGGGGGTPSFTGSNGNGFQLLPLPITGPVV